MRELLFQVRRSGDHLHKLHTSARSLLRLLYDSFVFLDRRRQVHRVHQLYATCRGRLTGRR